MLADRRFELGQRLRGQLDSAVDITQGVGLSEKLSAQVRVAAREFNGPVAGSAWLQYMQQFLGFPLCGLTFSANAMIIAAVQSLEDGNVVVEKIQKYADSLQDYAVDPGGIALELGGYRPARRMS